MVERIDFINECDLQALDRAINTARDGSLIKGPLESGLDRVRTVTLGLGEIFRILRANAIRVEGLQVDEIAADSRIDPPLGAYSIDALLGLGAVVTEMLSSDIENIERIVARERG